jgi:hypothetical protein
MDIIIAQSAVLKKRKTLLDAVFNAACTADEQEG